MTDNWPAIALLGGVVIFGLALVRWRERRFIKARFKGDTPLIMSFGVSFLGLESEPGRVKSEGGLLALFSDFLYYRGRTSGRELIIETIRIIEIDHGRRHRDFELDRDALKTSFYASGDKIETAAFTVPYPSQWIAALQKVRAQTH